MNNEKLLPCPFCGDPMKLETIADVATGPGEVFVLCDCGASSPGGGNLDEAIAAWNRRATPAAASAGAAGTIGTNTTFRDTAMALHHQWTPELVHKLINTADQHTAEVVAYWQELAEGYKDQWEGVTAERDAARASVEAFQQGACKLAAELAETKATLYVRNNTLALAEVELAALRAGQAQATEGGEARGCRNCERNDTGEGSAECAKCCATPELSEWRAATAPVSAAPSDGEIYAEVSRRADPEGHARADAEASAILAGAAQRDLLKRCLTAMKHAVEFGETGRGRPPQQTCMLEIEELEAILSAGAPVSAAEPAKAKIAALTNNEFAGRVIDHVFDNADNDRRSLVIGVASFLAMRQPDPAGEWVKRADLAMGQQGDAVSAGYIYGTAMNGNGNKVTLHYETIAQAEAAFDFITDRIDTERAAKQAGK